MPEKRIMAGEKALKRSLERLETLMNEIPVGVANIDVTGKITYFNKRFEEISGYSREEIVGKNAFKLGLFTPETLKLLTKRVKERLMGQPLGPLEIQLKRKDGKWVWLEQSSKLLKERGVPVGLQTIGGDITERKEVEELYRTLANSSPVGIYIVQDGKFQFVNPQLQEDMGFTEDELLGTNPLSIVHPEDRERVRENAVQMLKGNRLPPYEFRAIGKGGKTIWAMETVISVHYKGKRATLGNLMDITERKRTEEKLRSLFELSPSAIVTADFKGVITSCNAAIVRLTGYSEDEIVGKHFSKLGFLRLQDIPKYARILRAIVRGKVPEPFQVTYHHKDGTPRLSEAHIDLLKVGDTKTGVQVVFEDLTEHKRAEEERAVAVKKGAEIMDGIIDGVLLTDLTGKILQANIDFQKRWGGTREEIIGKTAAELGILSKEDDQRINDEVIPELMKKGFVRDIETVFNRRDGTKFPALQNLTLVRDPQDNPMGIISVALDVSELKRLHEQLVRSEKLAAIGQLAGGVGHELRNPLGAIKNAVYYIRRKMMESELWQKEPRVMEFLNILDDEVNASNKIIDDLLGFSRVGKPSVSPTRIERVIEDTLSRTVIPENIELTEKLDTNLPEVEIDADQVQQVLANIVTNAVQAMPEGGKLTIGAKEKERFLEVKIADTGCGIPSETVGKIFDPLFTTKAKGIGLGLAVCKTIIDRHEGNIKVESQIGKGTTFIIKLPLKLNKPEVNDGEN